MITLTEINIYPIKSLGGLSVESASLTDRGLKYDRRWMLVDRQGMFLTQRTVPVMSQLRVSIEGNHLRVQTRKKNADDLLIPIQCEEWIPRSVTIFDDTCQAVAYPQMINDWFSTQMGIDCELVFMPDNSDRPVDPDYSLNAEQVSFADGFPALVIGEASLADLNSRLEEPVSMQRFRPNLVFSGGAPFCEDLWKRIKVGSVEFTVVKPCARCVLTTVDPVTSEKGREPLKTLATYRKQGSGVMFGQNLLHPTEGEIKRGDEILVIESS